MNLYFNDLTLVDDPTCIDSALLKFAEMFGQFSKLTNEQRVWMPNTTREAILRAIPLVPRIPLHWQWALGAFSLRTKSMPREDETTEERFCSSKFTVECNGIRVLCDQMGMAALTKPKEASHSLTVGFHENSTWNMLRYEVVEMQETGRSQIHHALCLVSSAQLEDADVVQWRHCAYEMELPRSQRLPTEKEVHIRDDHGKDILLELARRLVRSPYVVEVINSLPFDSHGRNFVEKALPSGVVHLRLQNSDEGFGLAVRTSAANLDQTQRIARILEREFG